MFFLFLKFFFSQQVKYPSGIQQNLGNELKPRQVKDQPDVHWKADEKSLYTLCLTGTEFWAYPYQRKKQRYMVFLTDWWLDQ